MLAGRVALTTALRVPPRPMIAAMTALAPVAAADAGIQFTCWVAASLLQTEKFYDISASLTYILCVIVSRRKGVRSTRSNVNSVLVVLWATRLGSFLLWRVLRDGGDTRFDSVKTRPMRFLVFWAVQALWIFITALPVFLSNSKVKSSEESMEEAEPKASARDSRLCWRDVAGWALWVLGFVVQTTADVQKRMFRADPGNRDHWIDVGLWRLAQHPNYFGEMCMWWGIFLSCSTALRGWELLTVMSPCFVSFLLLKVSGVPILRRMGMKRWGHLKEYREYLRTTPLLVPLPRR
ncbi:unnamed protein product [Effrenium voratum]|nr:unnamed protein product [Effrenium voratum]